MRTRFQYCNLLFICLTILYSTIGSIVITHNHKETCPQFQTNINTKNRITHKFILLGKVLTGERYQESSDSIFTQSPRDRNFTYSLQLILRGKSQTFFSLITKINVTHVNARKRWVGQLVVAIMNKQSKSCCQCIL